MRLGPTNPMHVKAVELVKSGDLVALKAFDKELEEAGYAPNGIVRSAINHILSGA